jgi:hypothetical protein
MSSWCLNTCKNASEHTWSNIQRVPFNGAPSLLKSQVVTLIISDLYSVHSPHLATFPRRQPTVTSHGFSWRLPLSLLGSAAPEEENLSRQTSPVVPRGEVALLLLFYAQMH